MPEELHVTLPPLMRMYVIGWARGDSVMALALLAAFEERAAYGSIRRAAHQHGIGEWRLRRWYWRCERAMRAIGEDAFTEKYRIADSVKADVGRKLHGLSNRIERQ